MRDGLAAGLLMVGALIWLAVTGKVSSEIAMGLGVTTMAVAPFATTIPDLDVHSSKPRQWFGTLLVLGAVGFALVLVFRGDQIVAEIGRTIESAIPSVPSEFGGPVGIMVLSLGVALLAGWLLDGVTTHRGGTHTAKFAVVVAVAGSGGLYAAIQQIGADFPLWVYGFAGTALFVFLLTHNLRDGVY